MNSPLSPFFAVFGLGGPELLLIFAVILLLFGAKRLPDLAKGLGKSIKEFKKASTEGEAELNTSPEAQPKVAAAKPADSTKASHGAN